MEKEVIQIPFNFDCCYSFQVPTVWSAPFLIVTRSVIVMTSSIIVTTITTAVSITKSYWKLRVIIVNVENITVIKIIVELIEAIGIVVGDSIMQGLILIWLELAGMVHPVAGEITIVLTKELGKINLIAIDFHLVALKNHGGV